MFIFQLQIGQFEEKHTQHTIIGESNQTISPSTKPKTD